MQRVSKPRFKNLILMKYFTCLLLCISFLSSCINFSKFERGYLIPSKNEPVEIPFELEKGLIILKADVNGVSGRFLFDNGFSLSAVSPEFAERADIQFDKNTSLTDANSKKATVPETTVDIVNIKGQQFIETGFYQIDTKNFWSCSELDGVIGASIINKINWNIDFNKQTIKLSSSPFKEQGTELDITFSNNNSSFVDLEIEGKKFNTKIDFGKSGQIDLRKKEAQHLFSGEMARTEYGITSLSGNGIGNIKTTYSLENSVKGKLDGKELPISERIELIENLKYEAYIGTGYFKQYNVVINSTEKKYILYNPVFSDSLKIEESYGLTVYPIDGAWKIFSINPNDTDIQGIEVLDEVSSIDNELMDRFKDVCAYQSYIRKKRYAGEDILIQLVKSDQEFIIPFNATALKPLNE